MTTRAIRLAFLCLALAACGKKDEPPPPPAAPVATPEPAPIAPPPQASSEVPPAKVEPAQASVNKVDKHVVARGDTLYRIAKQHGLDHRELAQWNDIKEPRRLRVGQELRLSAPSR